ncbi:MAG: hypothetical protein H7A04_18190 [Pseudomonadales bacterium]|nr:hypothetical protein [Pseudomonadales bacterium]
MTDLHELVKGIIEDLRKHQGSSPSSRCEGDNFPRIIDAGDGQQIHVTRMVDGLIADIAHQMMKRDASLEARFSVKDLTGLVRKAFGPALAKIDLDRDVDQNAALVLSDVEEAVAKGIDWTLKNGKLEYSFGCTLFSYDDIAPIDIGPVRFEPRKIWIDRKASDGRLVSVGPDGRIKRFPEKIADGPISKVTHRRITQVWQGKKLKKRKASSDAHDEKFILEAIGDCQYVCSISVPGFGVDAGRHKALISARLALATVSLLWETPSEVLKGISLLADRKHQYGTTLSFTPDGLMLANRSGSKRLHAPWVNKDKLEESINGFADCFAVAGEAIMTYLDPAGGSERPKLMNAIAHALLWFYEGCRETVDQIAIVKLSAAMEVLTGKLSRNGSQEAIRRLIESCFEIDENKIITRDGKTMREVVEKIYKMGRTRMIHGENEALGNDWSIERASAEKLARYSLVIYMGRVSENPSFDNPKQLFQQDGG